MLAFALLLKRGLTSPCPRGVPHQQLRLDAIATLGHVVNCSNVSFQLAAYVSSNHLLSLEKHSTNVKGIDRLTLRQDLVADGLELALQVAEEIVDCFGERGGGFIGSGFVVHLLNLGIELGGLCWLRPGREGVGGLEEMSR